MHFVHKWDRITDRQTIQTLDAPGGPFRPGHKNTERLKFQDFNIIPKHFTCGRGHISGRWGIAIDVLHLRGHVSKHLALSVERVESPKICFSLIFGHMEA